jgi:hypothetical protein
MKGMSAYITKNLISLMIIIWPVKNGCTVSPVSECSAWFENFVHGRPKLIMPKPMNCLCDDKNIDRGGIQHLANLFRTGEA